MGNGCVNWIHGYICCWKWNYLTWPPRATRKWAAAKSLPKMRCLSGINRWSAALNSIDLIVRASLTESKSMGRWMRLKKYFVRSGAKNRRPVVSNVSFSTTGERHFNLAFDSAMFFSISANWFGCVDEKWSGSSSVFNSKNLRVRRSKTDLDATTAQFNAGDSNRCLTTWTFMLRWICDRFNFHFF